jgi:telomere length regulation protein
MALNTAEELIRKKRGYGTELGRIEWSCYGILLNLWLDENAVNLVYALLSLNDNFDLESFAEKRQAALNALVAGAPRKAPPYVFTLPFFC